MIPWLLALLGASVLLIGITFLTSIVMYNKLVRSRVLVREAFSGIDVQLKRRHDVIPNLVSIVEGFAGHEKKVLTEVTRARSEAIQALAPQSKESTEGTLSKAISGLLLTVENYPQLKSHEPFQELMTQLSEIEDDLQKSRRYYNGTVRELNTQIESIPSNFVAMLFGFHHEPFFTLERLSEQQVPHIQWSSNP